MNDLRQQVYRAQRRLNIQRFLEVASWFLFAALTVAAIGIVIPKIWVVSADVQVWNWSWIGGAFGAGILAACLFTYLRRNSSLNAAIEIDRRFGLKERVSSCLALTEDEQQTEAGRALVDDAIRRAAEVDVKEQFKVAPTRWAWLPFAMAAVVFLLTLLSDAKPDNPQKAQASISPIKTKIQNTTKQLKPKISERKKQALAKNLPEAGEIFKKLEKGIDELNGKQDIDKKDALVKLQDLSQQIKKRQKELGNPNQLRQQLNRLNNLKQGPADKMAKALKNSDFKAALDAINELQKSLSTGKLSEEQNRKLQQQLNQIQQKLNEIVQQHERMKQDLQRQIQEKMAEGDRKAAADLQRKLDQMNLQMPQMDKLQQMAKKLGDCQDCMKKGDNQDAAQKLAELAENLQEMQSEIDELEMLEGAMEQLADAKNSMNCASCNGQGCGMCQGMGMGMGEGFSDMRGGQGLGEGRGQGDRPEEESNTGFYDSRVKGNPEKGPAVVLGPASGPNKKGQAIEEIKAEIEAVSSAKEDPLTGIRLPKAQRTLTRQYFEKFTE